MKEREIREVIHDRILKQYHNSKNALVIDELGLKNGICRADIAVINNSLMGFEIKTELDSLNRLKNQVKIYDSVFDYSTIILSEKHYPFVMDYIPDWWGVKIYKTTNIKNYLLKFSTIRKPRLNNLTDPYSIAQLLWRDEIIEILKEKGVTNKDLKSPKHQLYGLLCSLTNRKELNAMIKNYLMLRKNWRCR